MSMTDPMADMLTRIRNACTAGHRRVDIPRSKLKVEIARILKENHFVAGLQGAGRWRAAACCVCISSTHGGQPVIRELQRVSTPGLRATSESREIPRVRNGLGMAILSTSKGLMSDRRRRAAHSAASCSPRLVRRTPCRESENAGHGPIGVTEIDEKRSR